jgi:hypothetical protein
MSTLSLPYLTLATLAAVFIYFFPYFTSPSGGMSTRRRPRKTPLTPVRVRVVESVAYAGLLYNDNENPFPIVSYAIVIVTFSFRIGKLVCVCTSGVFCLRRPFVQRQ